MSQETLESRPLILTLSLDACFPLGRACSTTGGCAAARQLCSRLLEAGQQQQQQQQPGHSQQQLRPAAALCCRKQNQPFPPPTAASSSDAMQQQQQGGTPRPKSCPATGQSLIVATSPAPLGAPGSMHLTALLKTTLQQQQQTREMDYSASAQKSCLTDRLPMPYSLCCNLPKAIGAAGLEFGNACCVDRLKFHFFWLSHHGFGPESVYTQ